MCDVLKVILIVDETLMRVMTFNWRYRRLEDRPQTKLAVSATVLALIITYVVLTSPAFIWRVFAFLMWLNTFYEWRLWYKLRKRKRLVET